MKNDFLKDKSKIIMDEFTIISESTKEINKILLLRKTHNLVCSYGESISIFNITSTDNSKQKKLNLLQKILDPNFNTIEFLYETKPNSNNENYLLLCSDMIHVYYLYENDKKSILLQSINQFGYQYINQIYEKNNGKIISLCNEYKISVFNNNLIENDEIIDYNYIINKGESFIEKYREEIYELEKNKLNKDNEKIYSVIEIFPDKLAYSFRINDDDSFDDNIINANNNGIDDNYIYIKFIDENYQEIKELKMCEYDDNFFEMFQLNEKLMVFINDKYINFIDLKDYEVVTKIKTNKINFSFSFQENLNFSKNNFFNYLLLGTEIISHPSLGHLCLCDDSDSDDSNEFEEIKLNFYDLKNIIYDGIPKNFEYELKGKKIDLNILLNISKILEMSIIGDDENNKYYCVIHNISKNKDSLNFIFFNFKIKE